LRSKNACFGLKAAEIILIKRQVQKLSRLENRHALLGPKVNRINMFPVIGKLLNAAANFWATAIAGAQDHRSHYYSLS